MIAKRADIPASVSAADLLVAREWTIRALMSQRSAVEIPDFSPETIAQLLQYERCAAWLLDSLATADTRQSATTGIVDAIRSAAARETQSAMRARVEGRELSKVAQLLGIPIVILKGGVRAVTGEPPALPLVDIDVLVRPADVAPVVTELERAGFGKRRPALTHHQSIDPEEGRLSIEVHWTTSRDGTPLDPALWERIQPVAGLPGLSRLGNADQLLHIVRHALINHRQRPVTIRDTLLAGITATNCSTEEIVEVKRQLNRERNASEALEMISFGLRLASREGTLTDPFVEQCATFYSTVALAQRLPRAMTSGAALAFTTEVALGRVDVAYAVKNALEWRGTGVDGLSAAGDKYPLVVRPLIGLAHLAYYGAAASLLLPMIYRTRRSALSKLDRRRI